MTKFLVSYKVTCEGEREIEAESFEEAEEKLYDQPVGILIGNAFSEEIDLVDIEEAD